VVFGEHSGRTDALATRRLVSGAGAAFPGGVDCVWRPRRLRPTERLDRHRRAL